MEKSELINILEREMNDDIASIDICAEGEDSITAKNIKEWYFEAEKVIRVLGNILSVPMNQAINQLRYAGHHVLKAETDKKDYKSNLIEAFKHCKRAVYDALDFYVYTLNERYRILMPYLDSQNAIKLERLLHEHIKEIHLARANNGNRIDYYKCIQNTLIKGLRLIEEINEIQRETGVAKELYINKKSLIDDNHQLQGHLTTLQNKNDELEGKLSSRFSFFSIIFALILTLGVIVGLIIADAYIVNKHEVTFSHEKHHQEADAP